MRATILPALLALGAAPVPADLLIRGAMVVTGSAAPFTGDVAVRGERIVAVGPRLSMRATRTVDAEGLVLAPGFIDPHTHVEDQLLGTDARARLLERFLMQGVTTAFIGNDGGGEADVRAVLASAAARPVGINYASYTGFGTIRRAVLGDADRAPTPAELAAMKALAARAMCDGALGLSSGLYYAPQRFAKTAEVAAVAAEAGRRGGFYDTHLRDESSYSIGLDSAVEEALAIGRASGAAVHIAHIKALGADVEGRAPNVIARIEAARAKGQRVTADQYPWDASGTSLVVALVPGWAQADGRAAMLARLSEARVKAEMQANLRRRGGAEKLLVTSGPIDVKGRTLAQIAAARRLDPVEAAIAVITREDPAVASFNQSERDIRAFMARPWVMTGSDASTGHPRAFGSFARKYAVYVRERRVLDLAGFVTRSSTLAADTFGLKDRGRIAPGAFADLVLFDPRSYAARATYAEPERTAAGVRMVLVNGRVAVEESRLTGVAAGRALRRMPREGTCPA
ncbi:N-acyl-D-amino-acid deacylase family protein [Sphingomonas spermidinifaciens]|uniref:N-acyl-D-amino-acid deacylase family protein n=1 Tax=Sphingomonas spermidinifaciens TaxID=1141889 RepID=UPI001FED16AB|nr:amidohydrolase family protein [Sphingomonas spermidinifaciens]